MSYTHFTLDERKILEGLLSQNLSFRKIAKIMGRAPSTISREVKRNKANYKPRNVKNKHWYNHWYSQCCYIYRRRVKCRQAIQPDTEEWKFIIEGLNSFWSPESISGRWHRQFPERKKICVSTIYRYIKLGKFPKITRKTHLRRRGKKSMPRNSCYNTIQPEHIIPEWPEEIRNRLRIGDFEGDTVHGGSGKGLLVTLVDRKSRYLRMGLLKRKNAKETRIVIEQLLEGINVKSISLDNGSEFAEFRELERNLNTTVYFAEPHKPWQRGTNENTNDIIRFFFPKGFDFRTITDEDIQFVEDNINNRPKKCLDWRSPAEVFFDKSVALD